MQLVSKSMMKSKALEYFRQVEKTGEEVVITSRGKPVLKLVPYVDNPTERLAALRGSVLHYEDPMKPVGLDDWDALK